MTRRHSIALFSGIGRRIAWVAVIGGLVVFALGLLLQAGKQQRQYRTMHQQQLRQLASQAATIAGGRIATVELLLRTQVDGTPGATRRSPEALRAQLQQLPFAGSVSVVPAGSLRDYAPGTAHPALDDHQRNLLAGGRSLLLASTGADGVGHLHLLRQLREPEATHLVVVEMRDPWARLVPVDSAPAMDVAVFDATGQLYFASRAATAGISGHVAGRTPSSAAGAGDLAWNEAGDAWVGAFARMPRGAADSTTDLILVAMAPDQPWSAAFWSALRTQSTGLPLLVLLALWAGHSIAARHVRAFQRLRDGLAELAERRVSVAEDPRLFPEVQQLVGEFNRCAETLDTQRQVRRVLDEIDALLLPGGDHESVIDQVLSRVRVVMRASNVGLTLVDPGVASHGRLFVVSARGGAPVNRVVLDDDMVATLRDSDHGLTVARCEEGRHSFLEPLQIGGSAFFWVWPVMAGGELVAILAIGYPDEPVHGASVIDTGTQCAQRLGMALSSNARAERLYRQAHFDPLTELPNRQLFREQLQQELLRAMQSGEHGALLYIDLDHFKRVNDSLGHEAGDQLLAIVAQRLRSCVKEGDTVARLGGDEFTVILGSVGAASKVSAVVDRILAAMHTPVRLGGRDHHVHASIGIAMFPGDGQDIDTLLHNADLAMYQAKELGRGGAEFYSPNMNARGARVADSGLYRALKRREFSLFFQPQYRVADGQLQGVEALLRWQKPRDGLITSAEFIPAAEESGLIVDIGGWVIEAACAQIAAWRGLGVAVPRLAVNLSVQQLRDPGLPESVRRHVERHAVEPACIEFEVSEAALTDPESQSCIEALAALGVGLVLDDFGTGNTALANLRRYPVAAVKIDRSFVEQIAEDPSAAALASTIIVMAHSLQKVVVAEGVETQDQLEYLRERGCDVAQGYFLARPLSAADMTSLLLGRRQVAYVASASMGVAGL